MTMSHLSRTFPAKLLLFGEYTVLTGSQALAVPLTRWKGIWDQGPATTTVDSFFTAYIQWLETHQLITLKARERMLEENKAGWRYTADIPIGYGLGSSGAFVAALHERYLKQEDAPPEKIREMLADMEGYFHGSSSGMDPMVSLSQQAVHKDDQGIFHARTDPGWPVGYGVYLLDSGHDRATGPLVHQYKEFLRDEAWHRILFRELMPMVDHAIHFYLMGTSQMLEECLAIISRIQRECFEFLIPETIRHQWDRLVSIPGVYVKLCGAGGGGYFLVVQTSAQTEPLMPDLIRII